MKAQFLLLVLLFSFSLTSNGQDFYHVPDVIFEMGARSPLKYTKSMDEFEVSDFITVAQYVIYLNAVKKDSSSAFYTSQLPSSHHMREKLVQEILSDKSLQDAPMAGVSWSMARHYCLWRTQLSKNAGEGLTYELPTVSEMEAFVYHNKIEGPFELETWTLNAYDESFSVGAERPNRYMTYSAEESDPPAMKRKIVYGGSFHSTFKFGGDFPYGVYDYQDSSSRFIGFRMVRSLNNGAKQKTIKYKGKNLLKSKSLPKEVNVNERDFNLEVGNVSANMVGNRLEGPYLEKYANGNVKVFGSFSSGQRTGLWTVWDEEGKVLLQRAYENNQSCEFLYPLYDHPYKALYAKHDLEKLDRNTAGNIKYVYVEEREVSFSLRTWRVLSKLNEPSIFESIYFQRVAHELFVADVSWYRYGSNADFKEIILGDDLLKLEKESASWDFDRVEIKEDFFFSSDRLKAYGRAVSVSFYAKKTDSLPSYTVYYPNIRSVLAKFPLSHPLMKEVTQLDDYLFFNLHRGEIRHYSSLNPTMKDWEIEMYRVMQEHEMWVTYGR